MSEENYKKLLEFVISLSDPKKTKEKLEAWSNVTCERSMGNYDHVFSDGQDCSDANIALRARELLESLESPTKEPT